VGTVVRRGRVREDENGGPEVEQLLSRAYIPLLTHLVDVFANGLPPRKLEKLLREAGRMLAADLSPSRPAGPLKTRVTAISVWLNEQLGAITHVEENGGYVIRGEGCPLSALTGKHPIVCQAMESLVEDIVGAPARQCCDRADRPRCCFHIGPPSTSR
jgi:DeoR family transcriptional regulator, suf operon transcriptional repressor